MAKQYDDYEDDEYLGPSKSELKRQAEQLQELGKELTKLGPETLAKIPLPDIMVRAIEEFHRMRTYGAQRRQLQLIGKYMRSMDGAAVRQAIDRATGNDKAAVAALHKSERLRDLLIEDDTALTKFVAEFPQVDVQQVRQLVRNARKEKETNKPPKSSRELYKLIHSFVLPPLTLELVADDEDKEDDE